MVRNYLLALLALTMVRALVIRSHGTMAAAYVSVPVRELVLFGERYDGKRVKAVGKCLVAGVHDPPYLVRGDCKVSLDFGRSVEAALQIPGYWQFRHYKDCYWDNDNSATLIAEGVYKDAEWARREPISGELRDMGIARGTLRVERLDLIPDSVSDNNQLQPLRWSGSSCSR